MKLKKLMIISVMIAALSACTRMDTAASAKDPSVTVPAPQQAASAGQETDDTVSEDNGVSGYISIPTATPTVIPPHEVYLGDLCVLSDVSTLDLSGVDLSGLDVGAFFDSLPELKQVRMKDNGLGNADYAELQDTHPGIRIIWDLKIKSGRYLPIR